MPDAVILPPGNDNPLDISNEPRKELDAVELEVKVPVKVVLPVTDKADPKVVAPDIEAVPPTSRVVFNVVPLLMPHEVPK